MINKKIKFLDIAINMRSRMGFMWFLTFFYQAGFIVAWIVTTSLFIEFFGIENLLWLFLLEATLVFTGSLLSHVFLQKVPVRNVLLGTLGLIFGLIFIGFFFRASTNQIELLFLGIIAKDLLYPRLRIGLLRKTESLFSPLQAERAIPMIDSALTIGVVVISAIVLMILELAPNLVTEDILFIWIVPLACILAMLFFESKILKKVPHVYKKVDTYEKQGNSFSSIFTKLKREPFLKFLLVIVLLQSTLYTVTEFEFIRQLDSHIVDHSETVSIDMGKHLQTNIFDNVKNETQKVIEFVAEELEMSSSKMYAHDTLLHDLTGFSLIFGVIALFVQFLLTPWVLSRFGIVRAINAYFAGFLAMTFSFVFGGAVPINFIRGFEHSFHSLFMSGYHVAFYSVAEESREFLRHLVEGMITPLGTIGGVLIVLGFKYQGMLPLLPISIAVLAAVIFIISSFLHKTRTNLAERSLQEAETVSQKVRAIEVLGQSGHNDSHLVLARELKNRDHHDALREKIADTLSHLNNRETLHTYIHLLGQSDEHEELKIKLLEAMLNADDIKSYAQKRHFMRFKMSQVLQDLFESAQSSHIKKLIIMNIFQHLPAESVVPFFNNVMSSEDELMQSVCLRSCTMFDDPDIVTFVEPYLEHASPRIKSHAVIALWKFDDTARLKSILSELVNDADNEAKIAGIYAIGEIDDDDNLPMLHAFSQSKNTEIHLHSLVARLKIGDESAIPGVLALLFCDNENLAHKVFNMIKRGVPAKIREKMKEAIHHDVSDQVYSIVGPCLDLVTDGKEFAPSVIEYLRRLYHFTGRHDDLMILERHYDV